MTSTKNSTDSCLDHQLNEGVDQPLQGKDFLAIEAVLDLLLKVEPYNDPHDAYHLFSQTNLIQTDQCSWKDHLIQCVKATQLNKYRSKKKWQDDFAEYKLEKYEPFRAFNLIYDEKGNLCISLKTEHIPCPLSDRQQYWYQNFFRDVYNKELVFGKKMIRADKYYFSRFLKEEKPKDKEEDRAGTADISILALPENNASCILDADPVREPIKIPLDELLEAAKEMQEITRRAQQEDPAVKLDYSYNVLQQNKIKKVLRANVTDSDELVFDKVTNIVGMVGSGKSTLIRVVAFWASKHNYRIVIVTDTVASVFNLMTDLRRFGISVAPLIGQDNRDRYIDQIYDKGQSFLKEEYSAYLTPVCLLDGLDDNAKHTEANYYGKEPCFTLHKDGVKKSYDCPYFSYCDKSRAMTECLSASVVITTSAGFATANVGQKDMLFLEYALNKVDVVIFDEADRVQNDFDDRFIPEINFDEFISSSKDELSKIRSLSAIERNNNPSRVKYDSYVGNALSYASVLTTSIKKQIEKNGENEQTKKWSIIRKNNLFTIIRLMDDLKEDGKGKHWISQEIYDQLYRLINPKKRIDIYNTPLWYAMNQALSVQDDDIRSFKDNFATWKKAEAALFPELSKEEEKIRDERLRLVLQIICFEHYVLNMTSAYESLPEVDATPNGIFQFMRSRFFHQQKILPASLTGNILGYKINDDDELILYRQYAYGRSLMNDLPFLRTAKDGTPAGPHSVMLSGSSWAPGSLAFHVNRPVNYILEINDEKIRFLEKTKFICTESTARVSGSGSKTKRSEALRKLVKDNIKKIIRALESNTGKLLLIVNSYAEARELQRYLQEELYRSDEERAKTTKIIRLISSDSEEGRDDDETLKRSEVFEFAWSEADILIAPALAIERGHNIVDEEGHSALSHLFFMVRPMSVPDSMQDIASKLNGLVESKFTYQGGSIIDYNAEVRRFAMSQFEKFNRRTGYRLSDLGWIEQRDIVASLFILILQIFGRLARVTDYEKEPPRVYFVDGAFHALSERPDDFDCLNELGSYLEELMEQPETKAIADSLYGPFYTAFMRDIMGKEIPEYE